MLHTKNILITCFLSLLLLWTHHAYSHADHGGPLSDEAAILTATKDVDIIVEKAEKVDGQLLDASWKQGTEKKIFKKSLQYFVVSFHHPEQKKTLYILLDLYGKYWGANLTGEFKGL